MEGFHILDLLTKKKERLQQNKNFMDFSSLLSNNQSSPSIIEEAIDPEKHAKVLASLCEKRIVLEKIIANKEINDEGETVVALMQLKNDMTLFGISEIDYQAYCTRKALPEEIAKESIIPLVEDLDSTG